MLDFIDDITAKDDTTVTISLSKPFGLVKERLTLIKIVPASSTQEEMTAMPVGINTTIQSEASSSLYANNTDVEDPQFDAVLAPGDPSVFGNDPDLLMNWWYGDNTWTHSRTQWFGSDGYNKLHELLDAAVASEGEAQQDSWNQAYDLLSEEVPLYPLFHRNMITGYHADQLNNFVPIGTTGLNFIGVSTK